MCFINNKCVISLIDKKFSTDPKDFFFFGECYFTFEQVLIEIFSS